MNLLRNLFRKRNFKLLLQGGILFKYGDNHYYVGAENDTSLTCVTVHLSEHDIRKVVYNNGEIVDSDGQLTRDEKRIIIKMLKSELESFGYDVWIGM